MTELDIIAIQARDNPDLMDIYLDKAKHLFPVGKNYAQDAEGEDDTSILKFTNKFDIDDHKKLDLLFKKYKDIFGELLDFLKPVGTENSVYWRITPTFLYEIAVIYDRSSTVSADDLVECGWHRDMANGILNAIGNFKKNKGK